MNENDYHGTFLLCLAMWHWNLRVITSLLTKGRVSKSLIWLYLPFFFAFLYCNVMLLLTWMSCASHLPPFAWFWVFVVVNAWIMCVSLILWAIYFYHALPRLVIIIFIYFFTIFFKKKGALTVFLVSVKRSSSINASPYQIRPSISSWKLFKLDFSGHLDDVLDFFFYFNLNNILVSLFLMLFYLSSIPSYIYVHNWREL